jgi:hypothetical protein
MKTMPGSKVSPPIFIGRWTPQILFSPKERPRRQGALGQTLRQGRDCRRASSQREPSPITGLATVQEARQKNEMAGRRFSVTRD